MDASGALPRNSDRRVSRRCFHRRVVEAAALGLASRGRLVDGAGPAPSTEHALKIWDLHCHLSGVDGESPEERAERSRKGRRIVGILVVVCVEDLEDRCSIFGVRGEFDNGLSRIRNLRAELFLIEWRERLTLVTLVQRNALHGVCHVRRIHVIGLGKIVIVACHPKHRDDSALQLL